MAASGRPDLAKIYRAYIKDIADGNLVAMHQYVNQKVIHNNVELGLDRYIQLLQNNIVSTGVNINIKRLIADEDHVAAVLVFTTKSSTESLVGVQLDGVPFSYEENVIYDFIDGKIARVHSLFDIDAVRSHARQS